MKLLLQVNIHNAMYINYVILLFTIKVLIFDNEVLGISDIVLVH